jgi:hypothetical protein
MPYYKANYKERATYRRGLLCGCALPKVEYQLSIAAKNKDKLNP